MIVFDKHGMTESCDTEIVWKQALLERRGYGNSIVRIRSHQNQFASGGVIKQAIEALGKGIGAREGIEGTTKTLACLGSVAQVINMGMQNSVAKEPWC